MPGHAGLTIMAGGDADMSWFDQRTKGNNQAAGSPAPGSTGKTGAGLPSPQMNMPPRRAWVTFLIVLLANYMLVRYLFPGPDAPIVVPYTAFKEEVAKGNVESIYAKGESIEGRFAAAVTWPPAGGEVPPARRGEASSRADRLNQGPPRTASTFTTTLPLFVGPNLETFLIEHKVEISAVPIQSGGGALSTLLFGFGPAILLIAFYVWLFRRAQGAGGMGGMMGIGKSKARRYDQETEKRVTFDDVAGIDEAENELVEIVDFLRDPAKYSRLGGSAPKGVLLVGAPGTGKTLLARAVAGEAGVPFFSMSASEFVEMIVGVGAARVRDLFKQAREHAPAIIFIDELDSIGRARGQVSIGGSSEQEQTLNQILTEMDGFSSEQGIIVLAATNQPDVLDKALLRPGRFDRQVVVNLPDKNGREAILKVHTRKVPLSKDVVLLEVASTTPGLSGADLRNLVNEAALLAARRGQDDVRMKDFIDSLEKIVLGPERALLLSPEDRERIAYHESGHAILGLVVPGADPGQPRDHRAAGTGAGRDLPAAGRGPVQLSRGLPARADHRHARRPGGGRGGLRHPDHRRRERHRAGNEPGAQHGHPLGHERRARHGAAGAAAESLPRWPGRLRQRQALQRGDRADHRLGGAADHRRQPWRSAAAAASASQPARRAGSRPAREGNARRKGDPGGHRPAAGAAARDQAPARDRRSRGLLGRRARRLTGQRVRLPAPASRPPRGRRATSAAIRAPRGSAAACPCRSTCD